jgi:Contractile injection system spike tip protein
MAEWAVDGGTVRIEPAAGWSWFVWDGKPSLRCADHGPAADGKPVGLDEDVMKLALQLAGRQYTATGFTDVPGAVTVATVLVDSGTLDRATTCDGRGIVLTTTKGTFVITCVPSIKAGAPPIPDPVPVKQGKWTIDRSGQTAATSG